MLNPVSTRPLQKSVNRGCRSRSISVSYAFCSSSLRTVKTVSFAAVTLPVVAVVTSSFPSTVVTGPTTVCPSFSARCSASGATMELTASHWTVTSPANSVLISNTVLVLSSGFASTFTMVPLIRSPFFKVTWSARALTPSKHSSAVEKTTLRHTVVLLYWFSYQTRLTPTETAAHDGPHGESVDADSPGNALPAYPKLRRRPINSSPSELSLSRSGILLCFRHLVQPSWLLDEPI